MLGLDGCSTIRKLRYQSCTSLICGFSLYCCAHSGRLLFFRFEAMGKPRRIAIFCISTGMQLPVSSFGAALSNRSERSDEVYYWSLRYLLCISNCNNGWMVESHCGFLPTESFNTYILRKFRPSIERVPLKFKQLI